MNQKNHLIRLLLESLPDYVVIVKCNMTLAGLKAECGIVKKSEITDYRDAITATALMRDPAVNSCLEQFQKDVADFEMDGHKWEIKGCRAVWEEDDRARFMAQYGI